jgi:hypothetical protein
MIFYFYPLRVKRGTRKYSKYPQIDRKHVKKASFGGVLGVFGAGTSAGTAGTPNRENTMDALEYLRSVYQNPLEDTRTRMRAADMALPFERPKLVATLQLDGESFASRLEAAIARSERAKVIETTPAKPALPPTGPAPTPPVPR